MQYLKCNIYYSTIIVQKREGHAFFSEGKKAMGHDDCLARTQEEPPGITQRELSEHLLSILYPQAVSI